MSDDSVNPVDWHERQRDDLAGYALDAIDADGVARIEAHLPGCPECQQALQEYRGVLELLPLGLPVTQPAATSRATLISRTRIAHSASRAGSRTRTWGWPGARVAVAGIAAALVIVVGAVVWRQSLEQEQRDDASLVALIRNNPASIAMPMSGAEAAPDATGNLFIEPGETEAALVANSLPQPRQGHQFQFWFIRPDDTRISGGVFDVDRTGGAVALLSAPAEFGDGWSCGVSEEPVGGSPAPTGRRILRAAYDGDYNYSR